MSSRLDRLYQDTILEHNKKPRNFKTLSDSTHHSQGYNPLCGDNYEIFVKLDQDIITDIGFIGSGCALSKSSASLMTSLLKGKNVTEALSLKDCFIELVTQTNASITCKTKLGNLKVFEGVKKFPIRVKCATLIWHAFEMAVSTEKKKELPND